MKNVLKHINKLTQSAKKGIRPVLQYAKVTPTHLYASDSFRAIRVTHHLPIEKEVLVESSTLRTSEENGEALNYPNIERLFQTPTEENSVKLFFLDKQVDKKITKEVQKQLFLTLTSTEDSLNVSVDTGESLEMLFSFPTSGYVFPVGSVMIVQTQYILELLRALKDTGEDSFYVIKRMSARDVQLSPLQVSCEGFDYIVSPSRRGENHG